MHDGLDGDKRWGEESGKEAGGVGQKVIIVGGVARAGVAETVVVK